MEFAFKKSSALVNKKFAELFFPTIFATASIYLGNVINGIIVGNLIDPLAMASIYACIPLNQASISLTHLISLGAVGMIAVAAGARENDKADYIYSIVLTLGLICSFFIIALAPFNAEISKILSPEEELQGYIEIYLSIFIYRTALMVFIIVFRNLLRVEGLAKIISRSAVIQQVLSFVLTIIFVGYIPFGIYGAGVALIIGDIVSFIYMLISYGFFKERKRRFINIFRYGLKKLFEQIILICKTGFPGFIALILATLKVWTIYQVLGELGGASSMVMYSICIACISVSGVLVGACCDSSMPIIGMLFGEKDFLGVRQMLKQVLKVALLLVIFFVAFIFVSPLTILNIYNVPASALESGAEALRLFVPSLIGVAFFVVIINYYSVIKQRKAATLASVVEGFLIILPAVFIMSKIFGVNGVWLSFGVTEIISFIILIIYVKKFCGADIFLIPKKNTEILYDVSLKATTENSVKVSAESIKVLKNNSIENNSALKVGVALEEMILNIEKVAAGKSVDVDIRIGVTHEKNLLILLRDNGKIFNPVTYQPEEDFATNGIILLKTLATKIEYNRILGLNQTVIEI